MKTKKKVMDAIVDIASTVAIILILLCMLAFLAILVLGLFESILWLITSLMAWR